METPRLVMIPPELIRMLSSYLSLEEVESLSETCVHIYNVLNDDSVWKRFLSKHAKNLETQNQQLEPPFEPNPDFCKNRQILSMQKHLLDNWQNSRFVGCSSELSSYDIEDVNTDGSFYKENHVFIGYSSDGIYCAIEIWEVSKEPVLHSVFSLNNEKCTNYFIFDRNLVVVVCCRVDVYQINLESKDFSFLYSYIVTEDKMNRNERAFLLNRENTHCNNNWKYIKVENYLVSSNLQIESNLPVLQVWDIANSCKVGAFVSPCSGSLVEIHSLGNNDWLLRQDSKQRSKHYFFKYSVTSKIFSDTVLEYNGVFLINTLVYNSNLIIFKISQLEHPRVALCQIYDCESFTMKREVNFDSPYLFGLPKTVESGRFIVRCHGKVLHINALTLEILKSVPCELMGLGTDQLDVYGSVFVMVCEEYNKAYLWNLDKGTKLCLGYIEGPLLFSAVNKTCTMLVTFQVVGTRIYIHHFW